MSEAEKTAAEMAAEERELAIKRGDIIPEDEETEVKADESESAPVLEGEGDEEPEAEVAAAEEAEEEVAEDGAAEPEAKAGSDKGEEADDKGIMIPKARFDEAVRKAREKQEALEQRLAQAEKEHARKTTDADIQEIQNQISAAQDKYEEYLLDGELEKARASRKEAQALQDTLTETRLKQQSQQTGNAAVEQIRYEAKLAQYEANYPAINPDSDQYSQDVMDEVVELKAAFEARGWAPTAAMDKAMSYVFRSVASVEEEEVREDPSIRRDQRAHQQRKKNAAAKKAMPPDLSKAGRDSDKGGKGDGLPDVNKMTPEQFAKWADSDPAALARLRGDVLSAEDAR